jgi:gluconokinase
MPKQSNPRAIILMGVSGCGKTTFGELLKRELNFVFTDGDDLHSSANVAKMASGQPLNDDDRRPWLESICQHIEETLQAQKSVAVACSALKKSYRDQLRNISVPPTFIHLVGDIKLIAKRQAQRKSHYMPSELMQSQFEALEPTTQEKDVVEIPVELPLLEVERQVLAAAKSE